MISFTLDCTFQGRGNKSSGDNFHAAPNIDHSQDFVRKDIKEWLCWMRLVPLFSFSLISADWCLICGLVLVSDFIRCLDSSAEKKLGMMDGGLIS